MLVAAIVWLVSPRSRYKLKRLGLIALLIAVVAAIAYRYSDADALSAPGDVESAPSQQVQ